jgi:hypothetical protein
MANNESISTKTKAVLVGTMEDVAGKQREVTAAGEELGVDLAAGVLSKFGEDATEINGLGDKAIEATKEVIETINDEELSAQIDQLDVEPENVDPAKEEEVSDLMQSIITELQRENDEKDQQLEQMNEKMAQISEKLSQLQEAEEKRHIFRNAFNHAHDRFMEVKKNIQEFGADLMADATNIVQKGQRNYDLVKVMAKIETYKHLNEIDSNLATINKYYVDKVDKDLGNIERNVDAAMRRTYDKLSQKAQKHPNRKSSKELPKTFEAYKAKVLADYQENHRRSAAHDFNARTTGDQMYRRSWLKNPKMMDKRHDKDLGLKLGLVNGQKSVEKQYGLLMEGLKVKEDTLKHTKEYKLAKDNEALYINNVNSRNERIKELEKVVEKLSATQVDKDHEYGKEARAQVKDMVKEATKKKEAQTR